VPARVAGVSGRRIEVLRRPSDYLYYIRKDKIFKMLQSRRAGRSQAVCGQLISQAALYRLAGGSSQPTPSDVGGDGARSPRQVPETGRQFGRQSRPCRETRGAADRRPERFARRVAGKNKASGRVTQPPSTSAILLLN